MVRPVPHSQGEPCLPHKTNCPSPAPPCADDTASLASLVDHSSSVLTPAPLPGTQLSVNHIRHLNTIITLSTCTIAKISCVLAF